MTIAPARCGRILLAALALAASLSAQAPPPSVPLQALGGLDPVHLCDGKEVAGRDDLEAVHFLYAYHFADAASRATFLGDPERYCIQFGGGCGRMGPLAGKGHPQRWLVHDHRIYIFASDSCRDAFKKAPEKFVPQAPAAAADDSAADDAAAQQKGRDACVRAVARLGGRERLAALRSVRWERRWETVEADGKKRPDGTRDTVLLPDRVRRDQNWGEWRYASIVAGNDGFFVGSDGLPQPMHATGVAELRGSVLRHPVALLRRLDDAGFRAQRVGAATVADRPCDLVQVACDGLQTTLAIAIDDGTVLQQRTHERGPQFWFGDRVETYSDFQDVHGLLLPWTVTTSFDGSEPKAVAFTAIEVDLELPAELFQRPAR